MLIFPKIIKLFSYFIFIYSAIFLYFGCSRELNVDNLAIPDKVLESASNSIIKGDIKDLNQDYAGIESNKIVADNYKITRPTDAELIQKDISGEKKAFFYTDSRRSN